MPSILGGCIAPGAAGGGATCPDCICQGDGAYREPIGGDTPWGGAPNDEDPVGGGAVKNGEDPVGSGTACGRVEKGGGCI